jgi:RNA-directed DNA polymerase
MSRQPSGEPSFGSLLGMQAELDRQARRGRPLEGLFGLLASAVNLSAAWDHVRASDGARTPGVDGVTLAVIERQGRRWPDELSRMVRAGYRPAPVRWLDVPKPNRPGQTRRLGILTLRDRVVLTALKQLLEPILEPVLLPSSFGFRPGRSVPAALGEAVRLLTERAAGGEPFTHAAHLDVADCFDTIDHELLLAALRDHLADGDVLALVERFLAAGGRWRGWLWWRRRRGLVQGSALSPLLCNLALHPLDAQAARAGHCVLRYADDLLVLGHGPGEAGEAIRGVRAALGRLRLGLRSAPRPVELRQGVGWLGVTLRPRAVAWRDAPAFGYEVPAERVRAMLARLDELTTAPSKRIDPTAFNPGRWLVSINEQMREWRQAYLFADNAAEVFRALDEHLHDRAEGLLMSLTGLRRGEVQRRHRLRLPRGFWTWEADGMRLTVLSSLAPETPGVLVQPPPWRRAGAGRKGG